MNEIFTGFWVISTPPKKSFIHWEFPSFTLPVGRISFTQKRLEWFPKIGPAWSIGDPPPFKKKVLLWHDMAHFMKKKLPEIGTCTQPHRWIAPINESWIWWCAAKLCNGNVKVVTFGTCPGEVGGGQKVGTLKGEGGGLGGGNSNIFPPWN